MTVRPAPPRPTVGQRLRVGLIAAAAAVLRRLPDRAVEAIGSFAGDLGHRLMPARTEQARRNLRRVAESLAAEGRGGPSVAAAARDPQALERLVRLAWRHAVLYYLDVARLPGVDDAAIRRRVIVETPDAIDASIERGRSVVFLTLHFGSLEMAGRYLSMRIGRDLIAPMETLDDPALQGWLERTRARAGVRIVPILEARRALVTGLQAGDPVGMVADRDITGGGIEVPLFGAPAPLPAGPALLLLEAEATFCVGAVRRIGGGRYLGRLMEIEPAPPGPARRERLTATLGRIATAFEDLVADAPEQWWAVFFPIWPDLTLEPGWTPSQRRTAGGQAVAAPPTPAGREPGEAQP